MRPRPRDRVLRRRGLGPMALLSLSAPPVTSKAFRHADCERSNVGVATDRLDSGQVAAGKPAVIFYLAINREGLRQIVVRRSTDAQILIVAERDVLVAPTPKAPPIQIGG